MDRGRHYLLPKEKQMKTIHAKLALTAAAFFVTICGNPAFAAETERPSADLGIALLSKYVWRGYELSKDSIVVQPSLTASYMGFGFNLWGNLDTDQDLVLFGEEGGNWNETDMTLSYDNSIGMVSYGLGYIYYGLDGADDTQEVYGSLNLDTLLAPSLTIYRDIDSYPGWYTTLGISHSFRFNESLSLEIGGHVSYLAVDDENSLADPGDPTSAYSDFHDGQVYLALTIPINEFISVTPEMYYSFPLSSAASDVIKAGSASGDDDNFLYGGVSLAMSF